MTDRRTDRWSGKQSDRQREMDEWTDTDWRAYRRPDKQTDRQTDKQTNSQTDIQREMDEYTDRLIGGHTDCQTDRQTVRHKSGRYADRNG